MKNQKKQLEEFWLEIGENSIKIDTYFNASSLFMDYYSPLSYLPTIIYTIVSYVIFNFQNYNCVL